MLNVNDVAMYLMNKDTEERLFNKKDLTKMNGRTFYTGNAIINKLLHLAQNIYIAKTGKKLFDTDFYAYDNGAVAIEVQEQYSVLLAKKYDPGISGEPAKFLDNIFEIFKNASVDELIELSHEDDEWRKKQGFYKKADQKMDSLANAEMYREQYSDILMVMEHMS